jgi:uncharacterized membrane protein
MNDYPPVVAKIAKDYLERVKAQLRLVPARERDEFLREIESHLYEAYRNTPIDDDVARILAVLRNFGEPAEVVAGRLPGTMMRSGAKRNLPLYVVGGIFIAWFGIPLGFGGLSVLVGLLLALAGMVAAFYATAGSILLAGAMFTLLGLSRILLPGLFDRLVELGFIQMGGPVAEFLDHFSPSDQGIFMLLAAAALVTIGLGMLWLGRYIFRGLRFLSGLLFDWTRRLAHRIRRKLGRESRGAPGRVGQVSFANGK